MIWVVNAEWVGGYKVFVEFCDGVAGTIDFSEKLDRDHRQIVRDLLNIDIFKTVKVDYDTLCWDNGVDFAPEYIYEMVMTGKRTRQLAEAISA